MKQESHNKNRVQKCPWSLSGYLVRALRAWDTRGGAMSIFEHRLIAGLFFVWTAWTLGTLCTSTSILQLADATYYATIFASDFKFMLSAPERGALSTTAKPVATHGVLERVGVSHLFRSFLFGHHACAYCVRKARALRTQYAEVWCAQVLATRAYDDGLPMR